MFQFNKMNVIKIIIWIEISWTRVQEWNKFVIFQLPRSDTSSPLFIMNVYLSRRDLLTSLSAFREVSADKESILFSPIPDCK